jgi:serine/threonine-protein kinase RsbW
LTDRRLHLVLPAKPENVIVVRQAVAGLGEALEIPARRVDDLKTVVTEACNNVVLHAYGDGEGPLEVTALATEDAIEVGIQDHGGGFQPSSGIGDERSLGLGLPLIASLSDSFEIRGAAGEGTRTTMRFRLAESPVSSNGSAPLETSQELEMEITAGSAVRPVLARVIGALAARAEFSVERLEDTVLIGDAVSAHQAKDFADGRLEIAIKDGDGRLDLEVGPLIEGGGDRILAEMEIPGGGSLRGLARSMEVRRAEAKDGSAVEYLVLEVASQG